MIALLIVLLHGETSLESIQTNFPANPNVSAIVGSLRSPHSAIPHHYLLDDLFCVQGNSSSHPRELADYLTGEEFVTSPYLFQVHARLPCRIVCEKTYTPTQLDTLISLIDKGYRFSMFLDDIPLSADYAVAADDPQFLPGFEIGFIRGGKHYVHNNLQFAFTLIDSESEVRISSFNLIGVNSNAAGTCFSGKSYETSLEDSLVVSYQYSVEFETRPAIPANTPLHRFRRRVIFPLITVIFSVVTVLSILLRLVWVGPRRDESEFEDCEGDEWKLVHGHVFRPPPDPTGLSIKVGWGIQILTATFFVWLSGIAKRTKLTSVTSVLNAYIACYLLASPIGGFVCGKLFRTIGQGDWRGTALRSSLQFFAIITIIYAILYFAVSAESSFGFPLPRVLGTMGVNCVLGLVGNLIGLKSQPIEFPQKVNQIPRQIPPIGFIGSDTVQCFLAGLFLFLAASSQIHTIMMAAWSGLPTNCDLASFIVNVVAVVIQAMLAGIVVTFWKLTHEDFRWWHQSYDAARAVVFFFWIYAGYFFKYLWLPVDFMSAVVFFLVTIIVGMVLSTALAAIAFIASFGFVQIIYSSLKRE
jgi:transmembrane 9 superfamily protein 2/4